MSCQNEEEKEDERETFESVAKVFIAFGAQGDPEEHTKFDLSVLRVRGYSCIALSLRLGTYLHTASPAEHAVGDRVTCTFFNGLVWRFGRLGSPETDRE